MASDCGSRHHRTATTLIETLVAMGIIGVLVGTLFLGVRSVRNAAADVATRKTVGTIDVTLERLWQDAQAYPYSSADDIDAAKLELLTEQQQSNYPVMFPIVQNRPFTGLGGAQDDPAPPAEPQPEIEITGALLLQAALARWVPTPAGRTASGLTDAYGNPILYYRARKNTQQMTTTVARRGIYNHADNAALTGDGGEIAGINLGRGTNHRLWHVGADGLELVVEPNPRVTDLRAPGFRNSFATFIWNRGISTRNEPYNKERFLLISAGRDRLWGTTDDITNFNRQ